MKKLKHIKAENMPPKLHSTAAIAWATALSYWGAPGWLFGVTGTIYGCIVIHELVRLFKSQTVEL